MRPCCWRSTCHRAPRPSHPVRRHRAAGGYVRRDAYLLSRPVPELQWAMPLCFIEPQNAIRVIADSVGREARRQILGEVVQAWVDEIPEPELETHYAKALADLDEHDLSMLAAWHASLEVGHPLPSKEFLIGRFPFARREPPRSAEDRRRLPRRGGVRGRASARRKRSTRCSRGFPTPAAPSSRASASSCTAGIGSASTTRRLGGRRSRANPRRRRWRRGLVLGARRACPAGV